MIGWGGAVVVDSGARTTMSVSDAFDGLIVDVDGGGTTTGGLLPPSSFAVDGGGGGSGVGGGIDDDDDDDDDDDGDDNDNDDDDDVFGDFEAPAAAHVAPSSAGIAGDVGIDRDADFGDFGAAPTIIVASSSFDGDGVDDGGDDRGTDVVSSKIDDDDLDFGDFEAPPAKIAPSVGGGCVGGGGGGVRGIVVGIGDDGGFGDFGAPPAPPDAASSPEYTHVHAKTLSSISDAFEGLLEGEATRDRPLPSLSSAQMPAIVDDDDDFGDFDAPPPANDAGGAVDDAADRGIGIGIDVETDIDIDIDVDVDVKIDAYDFGEFEASASNAPLIGGDGVEGDDRGIEIDDGHAFGNIDAHATTMSVSDAFEELLAEEAMGDLPLPSLVITPTPTSMTTTVSPNFDHTASEVTTANTVNDAAAAAGAADTPSPTMPTSLISGYQSSNETHGTNDDDLGDLTWKGSDAGGGVGGSTEEKCPDGFHAEGEGRANEGSDDFGDFREPAHNAISSSSAVAHSVGHGVEVYENDEFGGDFEAPAQSELAGQSSASHVKTMSVSDAFDELLADEVKFDRPLPPLISAQTPAVATPVLLNGIGDGNDDDCFVSPVDEFGDFTVGEGDCKSGGGEKEEELFHAGTSDFDVDDDNDGFGNFEDPGSNGGREGEESGGGGGISSSSISDPFNSYTFARKDIDDDFTAATEIIAAAAVVAEGEGQEKYNGDGNSPVDDFEAPKETLPNTSNHSTNEKKDILSSAFDGLIDVYDAPLPPLPSLGYSFYSAAAGDGDVGGFGGDEVITGTTLSSKLGEDSDDANVVIDNNDDNEFGDFEAISTTSTDGVLDDDITPAAFPPSDAGVRDFSEEKKTNSDDDDNGDCKSIMFEDFVGIIMNDDHTEDAGVHFGGFNGNVDTEVKPDITCDVDDDEFGEFEATDEASSPIIDASSAEFAKSSSNYGSSSFDAFNTIPPLPLGGILDGHTDADVQGDNIENECFGQFEAFPADEDEKNDIPMHTDVALGQNNDSGESFGQFDVRTDEASHDTTNELPEDSVSSSAPQNNGEAMEDDIMFGDFGGATDEFVLASVVNDGNLRQDNARGIDVDKHDNFGTFDAFSTTNEDDDFGQLEVFPATNEDTKFGEAPGFSAASGVHNGDAFGTFGGADTLQSVDEVVLDDNLDDFDAGFGDFSSFEIAAQQQESGKEVSLEEILSSKLGAEFHRLVGDWKNVIISAVENDLQKGNKIMDYLSNSLSSKDRASIIKSSKFRDLIYGLAEFVRVVRSITATIGDLLCVEKNIDVRESSLSQWNDNAIIFDAIVIENLWCDITSKAVALGISPVPQLESVVEIRARAINFDVPKKGTFCQLTLRPLEEGSCTQSPVVWNGKKYMACAANFCANRVPAHDFECSV